MLQSAVPLWQDVQTHYQGTSKYLGFQVGPSAAEGGWDEAIAKFKQRATAWADHLSGLHCSALTYNTFAIPVLSYLAQLRKPPQSVLDAELQTLGRAAPGPFNWATATDLWHLSSISGHPKSFKSLALTAQAAQVRVLLWDPACGDSIGDPGTVLELVAPRRRRLDDWTLDNHGRARAPNKLGPRSTFYARHRMLTDMLTCAEQPYTRAVWHNWFSQSIILTLHSNYDQVQKTLQRIPSPLSQSLGITATHADNLTLAR